MVVELRSSPPRWLSAGDGSQLPEAFLGRWALPSSEPAPVGLVLLIHQTSLTSFAHTAPPSRESGLLCKGSCDWAHPGNPG